MAVRVLHIDSGRDWRGGQRQVLLLAQGLRDDGYEPLVIAAPGSPLLQRLRARGLAASGVPMRGEWDLAAARRIRAVVDTWNPEIVHAHDDRSHALALTALIRRRHIPIVVTRRLPDVPASAGLKYGRRVSRFIAISQAVRETMIREGVNAARIDLVYPGVPAPVVTRPRDWRAECGWSGTVVLCGVLGARSGDDHAAVLDDVVSRLPQRARGRVRLVVLGGRGDGHITVHGVEAFRTGFVDDVHAALAGVDVLWHHTQKAEGFGTALVLAMGLRVPPVAFAIGAVPELVEDERNGLLAPPYDLDAFARAAARLIEDDPLRDRLAANGPLRAAEFDVRRTVIATARVYRSVLAEAGRLPPGSG